MTEKKIQITLEDLRHLFDLAVDTPLVCSGSFDTDDVEILRKVARLIGVDPNKITPDEFLSQYPHKFDRGYEPRRNIAEAPWDFKIRKGCQVTRCGKPEADPIHQWMREA